MMFTPVPNAKTVLEARYLRRNAQGEFLETSEQLFRRVAKCIAASELSFGTQAIAEHWEERFFELLTHFDFLPNSPTLMNAGIDSGQLSACFVLPVGDSLIEIFDSLKTAALIQQSGGGTGFSFSRLRPRGDFVSTTGGTASGPVSFMRIFDAATENIRQGGRRRGANMGILRIDHPDIGEFIDAKRNDREFRNFNLSVAATDEFMRAASHKKSFALRHPCTRKIVAKLPADRLFDQIVNAAWETGDPGLVFLDTINRANPTPALGWIEATNPCGEVPLLPYEACNLGSINLSHMVKQNGPEACSEIDWGRLADSTRVAVRFLDNVIDASHWPATQIRQMVKDNRKIGLGVMGFAEMLILLDIPYASDAAVSKAREVMQFIARHAREASRQLADERGVFPNWSKSVWAEKQLPLRNATLTSIAPTGSIAILAGTSPGIEPLFGLAFRREHVLDNQTLVEANPMFERYVRQRGLATDQLMEQVRRTGSLQGCRQLSEEVLELFRTALEIDPVQQLRIQSAFQESVDNAVSKTINLPNSADVSSIAGIYRQAWEQGLKGVTVYRFGSREQQVIQLGDGQSVLAPDKSGLCDPEVCRR